MTSTHSTSVFKPASFDWANASSDAQIDHLETRTPEQGRAIAQEFDWSVDPRYALCWLMAQKYMDLATALNVFLAGQPHRFNYMPKRDVPPHLQGATQVLDIICLRVNSGFFLIKPEIAVSEPTRIERWLDVQAQDRAEARQGRFVLDERVVKRLLAGDSDVESQAKTQAQPKLSMFRSLLEPVFAKVASRGGVRITPPATSADDLRNLRF